jgi:hypothetical protein
MHVLGLYYVVGKGAEAAENRGGAHAPPSPHLAPRKTKNGK